MNSNGSRVCRIGAAISILLGLTFSSIASDWGSIKLEKKNGTWNVVLENSLIKVVYGRVCITTFLNKQTNTPGGQYVDGGSNWDNSKNLDTAFLMHDGPERKTVELLYSWTYPDGHGGYRRKNVSIFKGRPYIRVQYDQGGHVWDDGSGGAEWQCKIYGAEEWAKIMGWDNTYGWKSGERDVGYYSEDFKISPTVLQYKCEHGIFGIYHPTQFYGFGIVCPISLEKMDWFKLIAKRGLERWMEGPNTVYYFPVSKAPEEVITLGKKIADVACGQVWDNGVGKISIHPNGEEFSESTSVELRTDKPGLVIHYTTDGNRPGRDSPLYTNPIQLSRTTRIKACAFTSNYAESTCVANALFKTVVTLAPEDPGSTLAGLRYQYYQGQWGTVPDLAEQTPTATGTTAKFDLSPKKRADNFAFLFEGYLDITTPGTYSFFLDADAGCRLYLGSHLIVSAEGDGGMVKDSGQVILQTGKYPIRVAYIEDMGTEVLNVRYRLPEAQYKLLIPGAVLSYAVSPNKIEIPPGPTASSPAIELIGARKVEVYLSNPGSYAVRLFRINGAVCNRWHVQVVKQFVLSLGDMDTGVYLLNVSDENRSFCKQLVILK